MKRRNVITRVVRKGKVRWKVDVRAHGTGRRFFDSKADAQRWLDSFEPESRLAEEAWSNLTVVERARVIAAWGQITKAGLTVADVWRAYQELVPVSKPCPLGKAIDALIDSKRSANKRPTYLKNLRGMLNQFAQGREALSIAAIRTADIEAWLAEHATTPGYRHTWINRLSTLFSFAQRQDWVPQNPCDRVERVVIDRKRPQILTVEQAATCAKAIQGELPAALGWFSLALFCGLRPCAVAERHPASAGLPVWCSFGDDPTLRARTQTVQPSAILSFIQRTGSRIFLNRSVHYERLANGRVVGLGGRIP